MRWLREHKIFSTVVAIIIVLVIIIFASFASGGGSNVLGDSFRTIINTIEKPFVSAGNSIKENVTGIFSYKKLQEENDKLREENEKLKENNNNLALQKSELEQLKDLSESFDFEPFKETGSAIAANIIAVDNSMAYSTFTVDVGKNKGIKVGSIVVDGNGLVGEVKKVEADTAKIESILSINKNVSFIVRNKKNVSGIVHGDGNRQLEGYLLNSNANAVEGDIIVTTGRGKYPKGIVIGKLDKVEFDNNTQLKEIKVRPTAKITSMQKVAIFQ